MLPVICDWLNLLSLDPIDQSQTADSFTAAVRSWLNIVQRGQCLSMQYKCTILLPGKGSRHRSALPDSYIQQLQLLQRGDTVCDIWASVLTMMHILSVWRLGRSGQLLGSYNQSWSSLVDFFPHYIRFLKHYLQFLAFTLCVQNSFKLGIRSTYYSLQMLWSKSKIYFSFYLSDIFHQTKPDLRSVVISFSWCGSLPPWPQDLMKRG